MFIAATVEGITKIMFDRFYNELLEGKTVATTDDGVELPPLEQARKRLFLDEKGNPYMPVEYLQPCLIDGGAFVKIKNVKVTTMARTILPSFLSIVGSAFPIVSKSGWRVDARGIVNQKTKARVMCYRPIFDDWQFSFELDLDTKVAKPAVVREIVDRAGRNVGLGVMRPIRKGTLGQFKVIRWKEQKDVKPTPIPVMEAAE